MLKGCELGDDWLKRHQYMNDGGIEYYRRRGHYGSE